MATRLPSESQWKTVMQKHQIKDTSLLKALATVEKLGDDKAAEKIKALDTLRKAAAALARDKQVAGKAEAVKFLDGVESAVEPAKKAIAAAAKEANAQAKAAPQDGAAKKVDLSRLKTLVAAAKRLAHEGKQAHAQAKNDPQLKQGNPCAAEGERAGRALVQYVQRLLEIEAAIATAGTVVPALLATGRKFEDYLDALLEWSYAIDEYRTCLLHAGQQERARQFEQQAQRARTLATATRKEGDALRRMK